MVTLEQRVSRIEEQMETLATKADLQQLRDDTRADLAEMEARLNGKLDALENRIDGKLDALDQRMGSIEGLLRGAITGRSGGLDAGDFSRR